MHSIYGSDVEHARHPIKTMQRNEPTQKKTSTHSVLGNIFLLDIQNFNENKYILNTYSILIEKKTIKLLKIVPELFFCILYNTHLKQITIVARSIMMLNVPNQTLSETNINKIALRCY